MADNFPSIEELEAELSRTRRASKIKRAATGVALLVALVAVWAIVAVFLLDTAEDSHNTAETNETVALQAQQAAEDRRQNGREQTEQENPDQTEKAKASEENEGEADKGEQAEANAQGDVPGTDQPVSGNAAEKKAQETASASVAKPDNSGKASSTGKGKTPETMAPRTLSIGGTIVSYISSCEDTPETGAGIWQGEDSATDGSFSYIVGHNPGSFSCVMGLSVGDKVKMCDGDGNIRSYKVVDIVNPPQE